MSDADPSAGPVVLADVTDGVATITLNRPASRNALNRATQYALWDAVAAAGADPEVAVVILTGADPAFCAGVDLKELRAAGGPPASSARSDPAETPRRTRNPGTALRELAKPAICAVNGVCVTGGLEIALSCDFVIASERAAFADRHARFGLIPGWGLSALLPAAVGIRLAREMSLSGRLVDAHEALRAGLANHVVPHPELMRFTRQIASEIVQSEPRARRAVRDLYARSEGAPFERRLANETELVASWSVDRTALERRR